jgi:uncharacterized protein (TIGR02246 family)
MTMSTSDESAQVIRDFAERVGEGDLEGALSLYEPTGVFVPGPGESPVAGSDAIREALAPLVATRPRMNGQIEKVVEAGDTALIVNRWRLSGVQPDGEALELAGLSADVLRRGADGAWRILIDDPWGGQQPPG